MISAIILIGGKIDKELFKKCLNSLSWVDEIVKIDTANRTGNFSDWRNEGARKAKGDWLLYVDTDEEVSVPLKMEIKRAVAEKKDAAYAIPRRNNLLGRNMRFGGWWPDYVLRLIKKEFLIGWKGEIHEQPEIKGTVGKLKNPLLHTSHRSLTDMVEKTNNWSEIEARLLFEAGHPKMNIIRFVSAAFREFWYRGVLKLGFLDGTVGMIEIIYQIFSKIVTYSKLWELQIKKNESSNF